jgi:DNA-binding NarL/FixJ family response regulator
MSEHTVKSHVVSLMRKLDCRDRVQVISFAFQYGLVR